MPRKSKANANLYKKFAGLAYKKHAGTIQEGLQGSGYVLDEQLSNREHKVLYNPCTKKVVVSYRGTAVRDLSRILKDLKIVVKIYVWGF